jgi:hypothetical protein
MKSLGLILALAALAGAAGAQTATGTIQGTVRDNTGAVMIGAKLSLTDQGTNRTRQQISGSEGNFEFRALPRGVYRLEAEQAGFKKEVISDIALQVAQSHQVEVTLAVGAVTEAIESPPCPR